MAFQKYLLIPKLMWYGVRAPRNQGVAWNRYWSRIDHTGYDGDVLWDAGSTVEIDQSLAHLRRHMDRTLPIVDIGCGNGRHARALAGHFPYVVGLDVAERAIEKARQETHGIENVAYCVLDATMPRAGMRLAHEFGEMNVYMRGVLHILDRQQRVTLVQNIRDMLGQRGTAYILETNHGGSPLDYMMYLGATAASIPAPLRRCIEAGIRAPDHFGEREYNKYFPTAQWATLDSGTSVLHGVPIRQPDQLQPIPAFFALTRPRQEQ